MAQTSPFLGLLMRKLVKNNSKQLEKIVNLIHTQLEAKTSSFHTMIQDAVGSRFIETFLYCAQNEIKAIYIDNFLLPKIVAYSNHVYANYIIQTLLKSMQNDNNLVSNVIDILKMTLRVSFI